LPARFELEYVGEDGAKHQPLMVHRALLGSVERFFGILIEHYAGAFPLWLAPVQVQICPVSEKVADYAKHIHETLKNHGLRVHLDDRNEKLPAKIRDAQLQKIPYMLVLGPKEAEAGTVSLRHRAEGDLRGEGYGLTVWQWEQTEVYSTEGARAAREFSFWKGEEGVLPCAACVDKVKEQMPKDTHAAFVRGILFGVGGAIAGLIVYSVF